MLLLLLSVFFIHASSAEDRNRRGKGGKGGSWGCYLTEDDKMVMRRLDAEVRFLIMETAVSGDGTELNAFYREHYTEDFKRQEVSGEISFDSLDAILDPVTGVAAQLANAGPLDAYILNDGANIVFDCEIQNGIKRASMILPSHLTIEIEGVQRIEADDLTQVVFRQTEFLCWKIAGARVIQYTEERESLAEASVL